jgi:hypothetical protein
MLKRQQDFAYSAEVGVATEKEHKLMQQNWSCLKLKGSV